MKIGVIQFQPQKPKLISDDERIFGAGVGFSLLETLIAASILIAVTLSIVALSNSLIGGTVVNADKTVINRWAAEGIELTKKIRDDNLLNPNTPIWFIPAFNDDGSDYGWYKLTPPNPSNNSATLTSAGVRNNIDEATFIGTGSSSVAERLQNGQTVGYRLICIESVEANAAPTNISDPNPFHCNTKGDIALKDGHRTDLTDCQSSTITGNSNDVYCLMTKNSVNKNHLSGTNFIPAGSAVKVRSVIVWKVKDQAHSSSVASLLTNWKGYEQN